MDDRGTDHCLEWLKRCLFVLLVLKFIFYFFLGGGYMEERGNDWIMVHVVKSSKNRLQNYYVGKKRGQG